MRIVQVIQSGIAVSLTTILTMGHFRLRELCAEQVRIIARYRKELGRMAAEHKKEMALLKLDNDQLRDSAAQTHNKLEMEFNHRIEGLFLKMAADRGIRFQDDATLEDMEDQLLRADRRCGHRVTIGSSHVGKHQQPRREKDHQKR